VRSSRVAILILAAATACGDGGQGPSRQAVKLGLTVAPAGARSGLPFATQPVVQLLGADGARVEAGGVAVTASVQGAPLVGTATATTDEDGRAVFTNLGIGGLATTRTLLFTSPNLQNVSEVLPVTAGPAARLVAATPVAQAAVVSSPVTARPAVTATDLAGNPVAGVPVTFAVTSGGGTLSGASQTTGGDGMATVGSWTLGSAAGANTVAATSAGLDGSPVTFTATALLLSPTLFRVHAGNGQSAPVGGAVATPPSVIVTGIGGQPVPQVPVTFTVTEGTGQITGASPVTNDDGIATLGSWVLGAGANRLSAASPGIAGSPVTFTATGTESGRIAAHDEPATRAGLVSAAVTPRPAVRVTTPAGTPLADVTVTFTVTAGGGSVTGATQTTSALGIATVGSWTLGAAPASNELSASAGPGYTGSPVVFRALGLTQLPNQIAVSAGNNQTGAVGTPVAVRPAVRLTASGTPVAGYPVTFTTSDGTVTGSTVLTGADGIATVGSWTLGSSPGTQELRAVTAIGTVTFTATALAGTPSIFAATDPNLIAEGIVGQAPVPLPAVIVADEFGNPLAGVPVSFAVASGGGTVGAGPQLTDVAGIARPASWRLGTTVGLNTLTATVTGLPSVTLRAQSVAGAPTTIEIAAGDGQTGGIGRDLPVNPAVRVRDQYGNNAAAMVRFTVLSGGGSGGGDVNSSAVTGLASARWRLGPAPGPNTLRATLVATGASVTFTAMAQIVVSNFRIDFLFLSQAATEQRSVFEAAAARWSDILLGDLPDWQVTSPATTCFESQPAVNQAVDDVLILVEVVAIDGPGGVLGSAGPCVLRNGSLLPAMGAMRFDQADLAAMQQSGELGDVILHEMAHVFGLGTIWQSRGLLSGATTPNPVFIGTAAREAYVLVGGPNVAVPVEGSGGAGTANAHWRESVFRSELMTGFILGTPNPLSRVTIGSLQDLGYVVDYGTADPFSLATALQRLTQPARQLEERPLAGPIVVTAPDGTVILRRDRPR
jgi:adhesin/invasin